MEPIIIHSYLGNRFGSALSIELLRTLAVCSHYYAKKAGFKIVLYTDIKGKELLEDIKYDEIIMFDEDIINQLPKSVWSAGKILAAATETRPFLHIDFDFFITEKTFFNNILDKDFFAFHDEPWSAYFGKNNDFYKYGIKIILQNLKNDLIHLNEDDDLFSVNFSIFGSCVEKNIPTINKVCQNMISAIIKHKDFLDSPDILNEFKIHFGRYNSVMIPVIIEQVLLLNMIKNALGSYHTLIKIKYLEENFIEGAKIGLIHLWDSKKNKDTQQSVQKLYNEILKFNQISAQKSVIS